MSFRLHEFLDGDGSSRAVEKPTDGIGGEVDQAQCLMKSGVAAVAFVFISSSTVVVVQGRWRITNG